LELIVPLLILIISLTIINIAVTFTAYISHSSLLNYNLIRRIALLKLLSSIFYVIVAWIAYTFGGRKVKEIVLVISFLINIFLIAMVWLNVVSLYIT